MTQPVLVIGGGLAGSAAAIGLATGGVPVTLIERETGPRHKVCGEFLSAEALCMLAKLGLGRDELEAMRAVPIRHVRLHGGRRQSHQRLPFPAMSLTRCRLDERLLARAAEVGVQVRRGVTVRSLERDAGEGWTARTGGAGDLPATQVVLATGKHDLRGWPRSRGAQADLLAMKMYWRLRPEARVQVEGTVALLLYPGGYGGLQPVEDGAANLCCLIQRQRLRTLGGWIGWLRHMRAASPWLDEVLEEAEPLLERPLAVSSIPYGMVRSKAAGEGLWAVGDQAAVIPSFTGDGMSIALFSGMAAVQSLLRRENAMEFQKSLAQVLRPQVRLATAMSRAMVAAPGQAVLPRVAAGWPFLLGMAARMTRIPAEALKGLETGQP